MTDAVASSPQEADVSGPAQLQRNALGLPAVIMQGVAVIAPAFSAIATFQFAVGQAGVTAPLIYIAAAIVVLLVAITWGQLAKALPSAGGFYTYVSRTVHPRLGFLAAWIFSMWLPLSTTMIFGYISKVIFEPELKRAYGFTLPWWAFTVVFIGVVAYIVYRGVGLSGRTVVVLGLLEIVIVVALGVSALIDPGAGGISLAPFNPSRAPSLNALYIGVVFTVFAFTGWEGITPMAEESKDPRRNVPRALIGSVVILAAVFVFCTWCYIVGLGTNNIAHISTSVRNPTFVLSERLWGGAWVILLFALFNSAVAGAVASFSAATRLWYAMARSGALPQALAKVHPRHRTPYVAIAAEVAVCLAAFLLMLISNPLDVFTVWALVITLGLILIYCMVSIGAYRFYHGELRSQFNVWLHLVVPVVSAAACVWVGYKSVEPLPPAPAKYAPIILAVWIGFGLTALTVLRMRGREDWMARAGAAMDE